MIGHTAFGCMAESHMITLPSLHDGEGSFPGCVPPNDLFNTVSVVDIKPGDFGVVIGYQVGTFTHTWLVKHFVAELHMYPGFIGKVSTLTHFPHEPGCEDYSSMKSNMNQTVEDLWAGPWLPPHWPYQSFRTGCILWWGWYCTFHQSL